MREIVFPLEFTVQGTPVSQQASPRSKQRWMAHIREAAEKILEPGRFNSGAPLGVLLLYFTESEASSDLDNILKPIFDSLNGVIYLDDQQIEWIEAHRFSVDREFNLPSPSELLQAVVAQSGDRIYLKVMLSRNGAQS